MGMSASQVRFLTLQGRKNSISRQLTTLSNRKMALSRDMNSVAMRYDKAMNKKVLKWSNDSGETYRDVTYDLLMRPDEVWNTEKPYIVTKASTGEVVLNDDALLDRNGHEVLYTTSDGTEQALSYIDIAKKISAYSGIDSNAKATFNNISNLVQNPLKSAISLSDVEKKSESVIGGKANTDGWQLPTDYDYKFEDSYRFQVYRMLGLISDDTITKHYNLLNELYGSVEAQQTGIYPMNSLWGQYYFAMANLEAFDEFMQQEHSFDTAETFGKSLKRTETNHYQSTYYSYTDDLNGTIVSNNTQMTQENKSTGALNSLSHIDFSTASGTSDSWNGDDWQVEYSAIADANGIKYSYGFESILENAVELSGGIDSQNIWVQSLYSDDDGKQIFELYSTNEAHFWATKTETDSNGDTVYVHNETISNTLNEMLLSFADLLKKNDMIDLNTDEMQEYLTKARTSTIDFFMDNEERNFDGYAYPFGHSASYKAGKKGSARANGKNNIATSSYGGIGRSSCTKVFVDVGTLFNTFVSFFDQLSQGETLNPVSPHTSIDPIIPHGGELSNDITNFDFLGEAAQLDSMPTFNENGEAKYDRSYGSDIDGNYFGTTTHENSPVRGLTTGRYASNDVPVYDETTGKISYVDSMVYTRVGYPQTYVDGTYSDIMVDDPYYDVNNPSTWINHADWSGLNKDDYLAKDGLFRKYYYKVDENGNLCPDYETNSDGSYKHDSAGNKIQKTNSDGSPKYQYDYTSVYEAKSTLTPPYPPAKKVHQYAEVIGSDGNKVFASYYDPETGKAVTSINIDKNARYLDPTKNDPAKVGYNNPADPSTWTATIDTLIVDPADGKTKTIAEYYGIYDCQEIKEYYTDFDETWARYEDSQSDSVQITYFKLNTEDTPGVVEGGQSAVVPARDWATTTQETLPDGYTVVNHTTIDYETHKISDYKSVWAMDPNDSTKMIEIAKDGSSISTCGIELDENGWPKDPNIALYLERKVDDSEVWDQDQDYGKVDDEMILTYDLSGYDWNYDFNNPTVTKPIYGTLTYQGKIYYFEDLASLQKFLEHPDADPSSLDSIGAKLFDRSGHITDTPGQLFDAQIETYEESSRYDISMSGYIKSTNKGMTKLREYLVDKVNSAMDKIRKKEEEIDNLYSSQNQKIIDYYDSLFSRIAENGWTVDENTSSTGPKKDTSKDYVNNKLQNNEFLLTESTPKSEGRGYRYTTKMATSVKRVFEVYDEDATNLAIAQYESEKAEIKSKEELVDSMMVELETEEEAINTTLESIKKIINKNIKKNFKMFA